MLPDHRTSFMWPDFNKPRFKFFPPAAAIAAIVLVWFGAYNYYERGNDIRAVVDVLLAAVILVLAGYVIRARR